MTRAELFEQIKKKGSFLCVGLDSDIRKLSEHLRKELSKKNIHRDSELFAKAIYTFNKAIVDSTVKYAVCYKPNLAFYEAYGAPGIEALTQTCSYIKRKYPEIFVIADAKRGDIGNTSELYARAFIGQGDRGLFDAITLSPYMGRDTVAPFLKEKYDGKWAVILALTSNESAADFELQEMADGRKLYEMVIDTSKGWGTPDNMMYVVGATQAEMLEGIRRRIPDHFLLVPGVGAQGGSLEEVARYGMNSQCGLLVNSSRGIIFADNTENFAKVAGKKAKEIAGEMAGLLKKYLK